MSEKILSALIVSLICMSASTRSFGEEKENEIGPLEMFNQRILPIFNSEKPSSCVQCHLSSVDLKNYILPTPEKTFASLRDSGLIDLKNPAKSKILTLIQMGEKDLDTGAKLIHEKMRRVEYEAFSSWIDACCNDSKMLNLPELAASDRSGPSKPDEVIRHARKSRVVDSFVRNIWSQRMRCFPCHTPNEVKENDPKQVAARKTRATMEEKYPGLFPYRMDIFLETPEATLQSLIEKSAKTPAGQLPLLNLEDPTKSLLVLKPLAKLPPRDDQGNFAPVTYQEPIYHGGGLKMHANDQSYKAFVGWIQDYANIVGDRYASVGDLPADNWYGSKLVLKLTDVPKSWEKGTPVQLVLHAWNEAESKWADEPTAFTQSTVTPRGRVAGTLFVIAPNDAAAAKKIDREAATIEKGKYIVKVYVDNDGRIAKDPALMLGANEFAGQVELPSKRWREGFKQSKAISANELKKE